LIQILHINAGRPVNPAIAGPEGRRVNLEGGWRQTAKGGIRLRGSRLQVLENEECGGLGFTAR
jgi:hypothetical protein